MQGSRESHRRVMSCTDAQALRELSREVPSWHRDRTSAIGRCAEIALRECAPRTHPFICT